MTTAKERASSAGWTFASTAITGLTNATVVLALQAVGGSAWLGAWAIASIPLTITLAMQRALLNQTVLRGAALRHIRGLPTALVILSTGGVALVVALALGFALPHVMLVVAFGLPAILMQDAYRMVQFGQRRPLFSLISDAMWLGIGLLIGALGVALGLPVSPELVVIAYVGGGVVAAAFSVVTWPRGTRPLSDCPGMRPLLLESGGVLALSNVSQIVVASVVSIEVAGELRLAQTLVQPVVFIGNFATSFLIPRLGNATGARILKTSAIAGALSLSAGIGCLAVIAVFGSAVEDWLSITDHGTVLVAGVLTVGLALGSANAIAMVGVRAAMSPRVWLPARLAASLADPVVTIPAGLALGAIGLALGPLVNNVVLTTILVSVVLSRRAAGAPGSEVAPDPDRSQGDVATAATSDNCPASGQRPMRVVLFVTSARNVFVDAWLSLIKNGGADVVLLADADEHHAADMPGWLWERAVFTRRSSEAADSRRWKADVEEALGGPPDVIFYWWSLDLLRNRLASAAWPDAHVSVCVDTYPNASMPITELRELLRCARPVACADSLVVASSHMADLLESRFRALRGKPMLPVLSPFPLASHYMAADSSPCADGARLRLVFTGRADYLYSRDRRMAKDCLGGWLTGLMDHEMDVYVRDPVDEAERAFLAARGFKLYPAVSRDALMDGVFARVLGGFDGNLAFYSVVNSTIARRVASGLSTRFANALCTPCPIIAPGAATFARDLFSVYPIGFCADSPSEIRRTVLERAASFRAAWHENHDEWAGERYAPDLLKMWTR